MENKGIIMENKNNVKPIKKIIKKKSNTMNFEYNIFRSTDKTPEIIKNNNENKITDTEEEIEERDKIEKKDDRNEILEKNNDDKINNQDYNKKNVITNVITNEITNEIKQENKKNQPIIIPVQQCIIYNNFVYKYDTIDNLGNVINPVIYGYIIRAEGQKS